MSTRTHTYPTGNTKVIVACDMEKGCRNPVTHIGEKGYVYCAEHAPDRRGTERVRKMVPWEVKLVLSGEPLPSYKRGRKPHA